MDRVVLNAFPIHSVVTLHDHLVLERARGSVTVVKARVEDRETVFVNAELVLLLLDLSDVVAINVAYCALRTAVWLYARAT